MRVERYSPATRDLLAYTGARQPRHMRVFQHLVTLFGGELMNKYPDVLSTYRRSFAVL
jgi:hypothetical protein